MYSAGGGIYQAYPPPDLGGHLLADLGGFAVPAEIETLAAGASFSIASYPGYAAYTRYLRDKLLALGDIRTDLVP